MVYDFWPDFIKRKVPNKEFVLIKKIYCHVAFVVVIFAGEGRIIINRLEVETHDDAYPHDNVLEIFLFFITKNFQTKQLSSPLNIRHLTLLETLSSR